MSKKNSARRVICLSSAVILLAFLASNPWAYSLAQRRSITAAEAKGSAIAAATAVVLKETSDIRELSVLWPVKSGAQSRSEIERMVIKNLDEESTPEDLRGSEVALKKLGLVPREFHLRAFLINLLAEQVAGYYDPKAREFFLADWIDLDGQRPVMVHELTHALQDQHFNLRRFEKWPKGDSDAELATHALIEGDATLAMTLYMAKNPLRALAFIRSIPMGGKASEKIDHAPRVLRESLLFPYVQGFAWAGQLYRRGGWTAVSTAFSNLPQSTAQIMQPETYFAHKAPVKVELANISSKLGKGWKRIDYDVNGEWSYYLILDEYLHSESESKRAVAGWAGDRYGVFEGPKPGDVVITEFTVWDTERAAIGFFNAYSKRTALRYDKASLIPSASEIKAWNTPEGIVQMERRGQSVLIMEGIPSRIAAAKLMRSVWESTRLPGTVTPGT